MVFSEDLGSWKNTSRMRGYKWNLLKVRKENTKGAGWGSDGVHWQKMCFLFQVLLKPILTHGRGKTQEIPTH
jgi:hypothetical protein